MTSTDATFCAIAVRSQFRRPAIFAGLLLGLLLAIAYAPMLVFTGRVLISSDDMAHGLFAPLVAAYIAWAARHKVFASPIQPSAWGLPVVGLAALIGTGAALAGSATFSRVAFLLSLSGCILVTLVGRGLRILAFPLSLLLFSFPIPQVLYGEITQPLQLLATRLSEWLFEFVGMTALRTGNIIELPHHRLSVVEACSGLRSLVTLAFFTLVYVFFFERRLAPRLVVVALSVPAAIVLNVLRITMTGILAEKINPALTSGLPHEILGWSCFVAGAGVIICFHQITLHPRVNRS